MKQILTALFVITASVATAEDEGRFITMVLPYAGEIRGSDKQHIMVTDTKLGKVRVCRVKNHEAISCNKWQNVRK